MWSSRPGYGFVGAARGEEEITESSGHFYIKDREIVVADSQSIANISTGGDSILVAGQLFVSGSGQAIAYSLSFRPGLAGQLDFRLSTDDASYNRLFLQYSSAPSEHFFGFGMQCSHFTHKGNLVPVLVNEQGIGRGDIKDPIINLVLGTRTGDDYSSYVAVPQYISSELRSLYLKNYGYSEFDLRDSSLVQIKLLSPP